MAMTHILLIGSVLTGREKMSNSITISADHINLQPADYLYVTDFNQPTIAQISPLYMPLQTQQKNCRNCGAPLNRRRDCEYCGTKWQDDGGIIVDPPKVGNVKSELIVTGSEIRMSVG